MPHVVGEGCGLRPARKGGFRLELEWVEGANVRREGRIPVIHNYGYVLLFLGAQSALKSGCLDMEVMDIKYPGVLRTRS